MAIRLNHEKLKTVEAQKEHTVVLIDRHGIYQQTKPYNRYWIFAVETTKFKPDVPNMRVFL